MPKDSPRKPNVKRKCTTCAPKGYIADMPSAAVGMTLGAAVAGNYQRKKKLGRKQ